MRDAPVKARGGITLLISSRLDEELLKVNGMDLDNIINLVQL